MLSGNSAGEVAVEPQVGVGAVQSVVKATVRPQLKGAACVCPTRVDRFRLSSCTGCCH